MVQAYYSFGLYDLWDRVKKIINLYVILGAIIEILKLLKIENQLQKRRFKSTFPIYHKSTTH